MKLLLVMGLLGAHAQAQVRFAILGDRTGGADPAVYERIWAQVAREHPAFVINVGDTIEGLHDERAPAEWRQLKPLFHKYSTIPLYLVPGNHDIWSPVSERLWERETKHPAYYSFTFEEKVHVTVLDNSRIPQLSDDQLAFLEKDLRTAPAGVPRLVFFHVPFWILPLSFGSGAFDLHRLARQYNVAAVVSGHGHQFLKLERDGIQYLEGGSSGGSLQRGIGSGLGEKDGWFYGYTIASVQGSAVTFRWVRSPNNLEIENHGRWPPSRLRSAYRWPQADP